MAPSVGQQSKSEPQSSRPLSRRHIPAWAGLRKQCNGAPREAWLWTTPRLGAHAHPLQLTTQAGTKFCQVPWAASSSLSTSLCTGRPTLSSGFGLGHLTLTTSQYPQSAAPPLLGLATPHQGILHQSPCWSPSLSEAYPCLQGENSGRCHVSTLITLHFPGGLPPPSP